MEYVLAMTFLTELGTKSNFSISGVKPDLTSAQINTLMDTIIAGNFHMTNNNLQLIHIKYEQFDLLHIYLVFLLMKFLYLLTYV